MTRTQWIEDMLSKNKTEEEIIEALLKGDESLKINPIKGKNAMVFARLNYKKALKLINHV